MNRRLPLLLESTDESSRRIAERCGLVTEANLRHHFAKLVGPPPTEYRRTFRIVARSEPSAEVHAQRSIAV